MKSWSQQVSNLVTFKVKGKKKKKEKKIFLYTSNPADIRGKTSSHILTRGYGVWFPSQQYISAVTRNRKCEVSMWEWVEKEKGLGSGHVAWLSCFLYFSSIMRKYVFLKLLLD